MYFHSKIHKKINQPTNLQNYAMTQPLPLLMQILMEKGAEPLQNLEKNQRSIFIVRSNFGSYHCLFYGQSQLSNKTN